MKVLLLGSGGREHALAWKLVQSPKLGKLYVAPGNAGTAQLAENVSLAVTDFRAIGDFIQDKQIDLLVVGPEDPLVEGIRDFLEADSRFGGLMIVGPGKDGAILEGSKDFAKQFMIRHGIPTAGYMTVTPDRVKEGQQFLATLRPPYVLKADGLAAGKGVLILPELEEAQRELEEMLGGFLGELSVNRYLYEDPILTAGYRPYTSGDPMRSIAWKQSVRGQGLMVKKWDYTTEPRAVVLVHADTKDYDHPEPAELCYSMARTICRRLEEKAVSYRFAANAAFDLLLNAALSGEEWRKPLETPQGYGPEHYRRVLEILGRATGQTALSCARFCAEYYHPQEQVGCIVVTTEPEEAVRAAVQPLPGIPLVVLTPEMAAETAQTGEAGA